MNEDRVESGLVALDKMLGGGYFRGDSTLIAGSPGTGKTTLAIQFLASGVMDDEPGVFVTFEYLPQQMYRDALAKGWDLKEWEKSNKFRLICTTPEVLIAEDEKGNTLLDEAIKEIKAKRIVIDSLAHFEFLGLSQSELRGTIAGFMNHLKLKEVTTLVTHEIPEIIGPVMRISDFGFEFLVDNVIILRYVEMEAELKKAFIILKFRGGDHDRKLHEYITTKTGIEIENPFQNVEGITSGASRKTATQRAKDLI